MGALRLSEFDAAAALAGTDLFGFVQNNVNVKETLETIAAFITEQTLASSSTAEFIRDTVATAMTAGSGISIVVSDVGDTITISGSSLLTVESEAGAAYTFELADVGKHKRFTNAGAVTATVPAEADVAFAVGTRIRITDASTGLVTLEAAAGVTLNSRDAALTSGGQYAVFEIEKVGADEWDVLGDVVA